MPKGRSESSAGATRPKTSSDAGGPALSDGDSGARTPSAMPNLLLKLLEACAKHKRRHDHERESNDDDDRASSTRNKDEGRPSDWCHGELKSFARVLPRMEASVAATDTRRDEYRRFAGGVEEGYSEAAKAAASYEDEISDEDAVGHLCALYRAIARGAFCTHAVRYLFADGRVPAKGTAGGEGDAGARDVDLARGVLPKITKLLQFLALDPARAALSPLKRPPDGHSSLEGAIEMYREEEYVGSTIAALLDLLQVEHMRYSAVKDLINLSNDLRTVDESKALFDPPTSSVGEEEEHGAAETAKEDKIRVHVFTEVARLLRKRSDGNVEKDYSFDDVVRISSRRSLLALQLGVWTALQRFVPLAKVRDDASSSPKSTLSAHGQRNKVDLVNSLLLSARSTSLVSLRPSSQEPYPAWSYSNFDVMIHALLMLRTKLAVVGLLTDMVTWGDDLGASREMNTPRVSSSLFPDVGALSLAPSIELALLAIESAKYHLLWGRPPSPDESQHVTSSTGPSSSELENHLFSMCSWAVSNLVSLSVLFPDKASVPKNDIWAHSFPHLLHCIPFMADPSNECSSTDKCLCRVVLRVIHAMLSSSKGSVSNQSTPQASSVSSILAYPDAPSFLDQFRNRCLVRGYFSHLLELVVDSSESVSGPAVKVLEYLLDSQSPEDRNLVENACLNALGALKANGPDPSGMGSETSKDSPLVRLGSKRRKLEPCPDDKAPISVGVSIESSFVHAISGALVDAQNIIAMLVRCSKHDVLVSGGPQVISLFSESDTVMLRGVAGVLRILLSMRSKLYDTGLKFNATDQVIARLLQSFKRVSEVLARQRSEDGKLIFVEQKLLNAVLSSMVGVGLHACRVQNGSSIDNLAAREAISYCAIATLPMIDFDQCSELDEGESSRMIAAANKKRLCRGICCRLASMIGAIARPSSDICLCRLVGGANGRFERESGAFSFDDTLPLLCRCIFLATMCPVTSDSEHNDTTLSSIRCILTNSLHSQAPMTVKTTLLGLPNLFLSLVTSEKRGEAASAKYLTVLIDSFCGEDLVTQCAKSDIKGIRINAMLCLTRLAKIYTAASLVASGGHGGPGGEQLCHRSSYIWQHLNPAISGMHRVILSLLSLDGCFFAADHTTRGEHPIFRDDRLIPFHLTKSDSPQQWMAYFIYLQAFLALVPGSRLRSSNTHEFFSNKGHYDLIEKIAKEMNNGTRDKTSVSAKVPCPVWLFLIPFFGYDSSAQTSAVEAFGRLLFCNGCKVFSAFFIPESDSKTSLNEVSNETTRKAVNMLFNEIDFMLGFCGFGGDILFSIEMEKVPRISDAKIAIGVFRSLCRWSPLNITVGGLILERSLLALVRIWIASSGGHAFDSEVSSIDPTCHSSLASSAFHGLNGIFLDSSKSTEFMKHVDGIMSKIFCEFFLPPTQHTINAKTRYRLLTVFIGTFLLPQSATRSLRTQNTSEVSSVFEIIMFIDSVYPSVLVQMIKDEDHEAIQMCAAFRMYMLSEAKKLNKEEKRVQKKNVDELIAGTRQEKGSNSRSLVPGVSISTAKLDENAKLLCIKTDVISHVLPQLLLHPGRAPLRFFTTKVCQSELNYPDILKEIGLPVLKKLVWELGRPEDEEEEMCSDPATENYPKRKDIIAALTKGFLLREGSESSKVKRLLMSQGSAADDELCTDSAGSWIAPNFMYLLVNLVLHQWEKRNEREKFQVIKCLRAMLHFLPPSDSPQYMPQIMTAINNAISSTSISGETHVDQISKLHFIAVATLFDYIRIVTSHDATHVGENLTTIVVALFPLFNDDEFNDRDNNLARRHAVQMLEWLADGDSNENLPLYFSEIPFLPFTKDLKKVRNLLREKGLQLDDTRLMCKKTGPHNDVADNAHLELKFYKKMNMLSQLILAHENKNVREVVIRHMTDLINANRDLFQNLVLNEELSSMNFLTVVHDPSSEIMDTAPDDESRINGGLITKLLIRLLLRCVDESDRDIQDALASCLGEIGAIDPNRLGNEINSSQFVANSLGSDDSNGWRRSNPPWKTEATEYQLRLVTNDLVSGLKSAPAALDQHKISFAIQELLRILHDKLGGKNENKMTPLLKEKLQEADVSNIVEPFWSTNYKQVDTVAAKCPPFFQKSTTYFSWLSSVCRYLVTRSKVNKRSVWRDFFHACRSAIRSQAGVGVAEFLLPLLILDAMCFGEKVDEDVVINEFLHVLSFEGDDTAKAAASFMNLREREKAANVVFTAMDVLRHWLEREVELKHKSSRGKSKRKNSNYSNEWPATTSIRKIERLLKRIPLSSCAMAASKVGMHARALQFLEAEGRIKALWNGENHDPNRNDKGVLKFLNAHFLDGVDLQLMQALLGQLNDFDTMVFLAQKTHQTDLKKRLAEEAAEREMCEDWEGAFQAYEQLLDSRLNDDTQKGPNSAIENAKDSAQKGLLRCLLKLGRLDSVLNQAFGMSKQITAHGSTPQICAHLLPSAAEAAWRLGKWPVLDNLVNNADDGSAFDVDARYQLSFGRTMHSLHSKSHARVISCLKDSREYIMSSLSSAARDGYTRSYPYLMQLHALREVEHISSLFFKDESKFQQSFINVVSSDQWNDRLDLSTPDIAGSSAILNTRLALSRMGNQPAVEGLMWMNIGKVARKGGLYQVAEQSLTQANVCFCKVLNERTSMEDSISSSARESIGNIKLQVAKLKHAIGESMTALKLIEDDIPTSIFLMEEKQLKSYVLSETTAESGEAVARRILQATEWMACDGLKSGSEIKERYQTVLKLAPQWERAHFTYAKFLDALYETRKNQMTGKAKEEYNKMNEKQKKEVDPQAAAISIIVALTEYLIGSVQHYGMALQLGQKHVFQALPRLLAMWLEFTSLETGDVGNGADGGQSDQTGSKLCENQQLMNVFIKSFVSKIPEHIFFTALPQLLSRVVHKNAETSRNVALILRTVLAKYPRQSLWSCGWLRFSKSEQKKKAGDEMFHGAMRILRSIERGDQMQNVLHASKSLFQFFISLAQFVPRGTHTSVKMKVPKFDTELKNFIPPIQAALSLSPGALERSATTDVFPSFVPRMRAFNPELKIMQSKAKPKKVSIFAVSSSVAQRDKLSEDGKPISHDAGELHFLVKQEAKGDLRKDSRVQDLNNVINRIFAGRKGSSGPNSRRQRLRLRLRTFSVVCLAEDCGILEWVPNTESLRSVITETYNPQFPPDSIHRRGGRITDFADVELRTTFLKCQEVYFTKGDLDLAIKKFDQLILKQYLPIMYWWFIQNFRNPHSWFEARTNFTLSTAVWSAVGHIIGLGDRHSENILVDTSSGECVHVDFDCIFDKGLLLPRPEVIPFRLTPNMLDAFGPTGADGMYAGALTESMRTLRNNRDTLLSVLEPFLNDPVINFKSKSRQKTKENEADDAKKAMDSIANIKGRLDGEYNLINPNTNEANKNKDAPNMVDSVHFTKLSVEGQVQKMIMEATSHGNLVQVYVGWMPWV